MSKAKLAHYSEIFAESSGDYLSLWKVFSKILHPCPKIYLRDHHSIGAPAIKSLSFALLSSLAHALVCVESSRNQCWGQTCSRCCCAGVLQEMPITIWNKRTGDSSQLLPLFHIATIKFLVFSDHPADV